MIKWQGRPIGSCYEGQREIDVPTLGSFEATDAYISAQSKSRVAIYFSDPVDVRQDLERLIHWADEAMGTQLRTRLVVDSNVVYVHTQRAATGNYKLTAEQGIRSTLGDTLAKRFEKIIVVESMKPDVQLVGEGVILPSSQGLIFPFKAVSLSGVMVRNCADTL